MGEASAILAINSLDRYITSFRDVSSFMTCAWNNATTSIYTGPDGTQPVIGAIVTSPGTGWPAGVVTIVSIISQTTLGTLFQISVPTTADSITQQLVTQTYPVSAVTAPQSNSLVGQYLDSAPYSYNFQIQSPNNLIYGYIRKIIVSQIQLQYNIPTISKNKNDTFVIAKAGPVYVSITIPHGFYYADELASAMQNLIQANPQLSGLNITVTFIARDGFQFLSGNSTPFYFPNPVDVPAGVMDKTNLYKTYRLLGMTIANAVPAVNQTSFDYPNFLYTPYIDIYSDVLTNYQDIKDTNTSVGKYKGMVARIYVSGTGQIQVTGSTTALGTAPFVMTSDLNSPKVINWTPDVAVPNLDFQLYDQYGDFIPGAEEGFSTEFQMTLLCVEKD